MPLRRRTPSPLAAAALGAGAAAALRALNARAVRALLDHNVAALRRGDPRPMASCYAADARVVFPGTSTWGRTYQGRAEIEGFLRRFLAAGLQGEIEEVLVQGPPWRTTLAVRFNDEARDPDGTVVYANRAIILAHLRWGRIVDEEVYEDTEKSLAFDEHLAARGAPAARVTAPGAR